LRGVSLASPVGPSASSRTPIGVTSRRTSHDMRGRARRVLVICFFLVACAFATRARGEPANGGDEDAERALYESLPNDEATLSELFQWSIEHGDLDHLREMARLESERESEGGSVGDTGRRWSWFQRAAATARRVTRRARRADADDGRTRAIAGKKDSSSRTVNIRQKRGGLSAEEIERKRREVKEALDAMNGGRRSAHELARECGEIIVDAHKNETKERRMAALELLYELVAPIELANDLGKIGVADALIGALRDDDEDVAGAAASALAAAASNNVIVQGIIREKGGFDVLMSLVSATRTPEELRHKSLWVLGMCVRTHAPSREDFFAADGARVLGEVLSRRAPKKTRTRAIALLGDLLHVEGVPDALFADEDATKRVLADVADVALDASSSADAAEKSLAVLRASRERAPEMTREILTTRENDFIAVADRLDAEAKREDDGYAADVARLARALVRESREGRDEL
jgi:hsp70-interacting protein